MKPVQGCSIAVIQGCVALRRESVDTIGIGKEVAFRREFFVFAVQWGNLFYLAQLMRDRVQSVSTIRDLATHLFECALSVLQCIEGGMDARADILESSELIQEFEVTAWVE